MPSGQFKISYRDDLKIFQTTWTKSWLCVLMVVLIVLPFVVGQYFLYIANLIPGETATESSQDLQAPVAWITSIDPRTGGIAVHLPRP